MKKLLFLTIICAAMAACGGSGADKGKNPYQNDDAGKKESNGNPAYDPQRGEGKFDRVDISPSLNTAMADGGKKVYDVKCSACHKLNNEKLVGPGWLEVTKRHKPEWIMNFITNTDAMISKDPKAQAQLEICLVRMPNQNLSDDDARGLLEFMRQNDGVK